jgi:abhydrolase domain-containing protein 6
MTTLLILLAALVAAFVLVYLLAPSALLQWVRKLQRGKGGLVQKSVRVGDMTWPYLEGGNPAGKPLVLVHGFGGDKDNWSFYAPYIKQDYRLIFPDLPGFGENDRSMAPDHSIAAQAERLRGFLDTLKIGKCHLGGNSMGGAIALRFAPE